MESLLHDIAHFVALGIEAIAIALIAVGAVETLIGIVRAGVRADRRHQDLRILWMKFAHWLVAGLTFQLAADIVNTSFEPTWDEIGHLAAIAAIRTFLSFFLDREMSERSELPEKRDTK